MEISTLLAGLETGVLDLPNFYQILQGLELPSSLFEDGGFGAGEAPNQVWFLILQKMKKDPKILIDLYYKSEYRCVLQEKVIEEFRKSIKEYNKDYLIELFKTCPERLRGIILDHLLNKFSSDELQKLFLLTQDNKVQERILDKLRAIEIDSPTLTEYSTMFMWTRHVHIQRKILEIGVNWNELSKNALLEMFEKALHQDDKKTISSIIDDIEMREEPLLKTGEMSDKALVSALFFEEQTKATRVALVEEIKKRMNYRLSLFIIATILSPKEQLGWLDILGPTVQLRKIESSKKMEVIKRLPTSDLLWLFTNIEDSSSPIRHIIGVELKNRKDFKEIFRQRYLSPPS